MKGIDDIAFEDFFQMADSLTSGHTLKLFKPRCNKSVRQNSFSVRIIEEWSSLPEDTISSLTVFQFKTKLDNLWINKRFEDTDIYCTARQYSPLRRKFME